MLPMRTGPLNKRALIWFMAFLLLFLLSLGLFVTFLVALNIFPATIALCCMILCYWKLEMNRREV
jgi:hypothetical protein